MASSKKVRVAIIGLGFGAEFIPIYQQHPNAEMYAICRRNKAELDRCGDQFGVKVRYADYNKLLKDPHVDVVHINSPIPDHAPQAIAALQPGEVVIDLGSGSGFDCFLAAGQVGPAGKVIGVDMTHEMLKKARENAAKIGAQNVEFRLGELEHLPIADNTADDSTRNGTGNTPATAAELAADHAAGHGTDDCATVLLTLAASEYHQGNEPGRG